MKNIIYKVVFSALMLTTLTNCDNYLDPEPETFFLVDQVYTTQGGQEAAITGIYVTMSSGQYYGSGWHGLVNPISGRFTSNQAASVDATSLNCTPNNIWLPDLWAKMYETIHNCNNLIYEVEKNNLNLPDEDFILGQAYFIRGVVYFDLVRLFNGVPLRTKPTTIETIYQPKSTKAQVYEQVIADLEKAKTLMPDIGEYKVERPKKYAANVYLAKVYMTLAGEDGGDPSKWQLAKNELQPVINKYSLVDKYATLFTPGFENTSESIFELQYGHTGGVRNSDVVRMYMPQGYFKDYTTFGRIRPNKEVFDQHRTQYPNDPRINATFLYNSYMRYNSNTNQWVNQNIYPTTTTGNNSYVCLNKWFDTSYNGTTTARNYILLRYSDVLLMLAEIENEINGPNADAYNYVNLVLTRARNSVTPAAAQPANWSGLTQNEFRIKIMKERQFELLGEGQDWFDTRRRGYQFFLDNLIIPHNTYSPNLTSGGVDYIYPISVKNMLLPIPAIELNSNNAMSPADQNPGY